MAREVITRQKDGAFLLSRICKTLIQHLSPVSSGGSDSHREQGNSPSLPQSKVLKFQRFKKEERPPQEAIPPPPDSEPAVEPSAPKNTQDTRPGIQEFIQLTPEHMEQKRNFCRNLGREAYARAIKVQKRIGRWTRGIMINDEVE